MRIFWHPQCSLLADCVAKLRREQLARNNRIVANRFLNQRCVSVAGLESILLVRASKIVWQHNRPISVDFERASDFRCQGTYLGHRKSVAHDPECMVRPCVARGFRRSGGCAVLHQCIRPVIGAHLAPGHHGYQRACELFSGQASNGPFGSPVFACAGKTDPPSRLILSQTSAG